jgi:hypothetical protein
MSAAVEVTEPYLPIFRNVPASGPGVCRVCHTGPNASFEECFGCHRTMNDVSRPTVRVVPISLCVRGEQMYDIVARHREPVPREAFLDRTTFLAATVSRFYQAHAACLGSPTLVTTVPSTRTGEPVPFVHPMTAVIGRIAALIPAHRPVLWRGNGPIGPQRSHDRAFEVRGDVRNAAVLVVDDLFVSGARVQSAASALLMAGAASVTALVVARLIDPAFNDNCARLWVRACGERFAFDRCCLEAPRTVSH